jgi:hypothetical protein
VIVVVTAGGAGSCDDDDGIAVVPDTDVEPLVVAIGAVLLFWVVGVVVGSVVDAVFNSARLAAAAAFLAAFFCAPLELGSGSYCFNRKNIRV